VGFAIQGFSPVMPEAHIKRQRFESGHSANSSPLYSVNISTALHSEATVQYRCRRLK
jgi:hypothetical protein